MDKFTLKNRVVVENVKELGYNFEDFYPWRFSRKLSLLLKPVIVCEHSSIVYFSSRVLLDTFQYIIENILSGRYTPRSSAMKSYLSEINYKNGKDFNNEAYAFLLKLKLEGFIVEKEVSIGPNCRLRNSEDIGDIDIFIADKVRKKIVCIESKCIIDARTPYEMGTELKKFISGSKPWIPKVDRRKEWINLNKASLNVLKIDTPDEYDIEYIFLTSESISLQFIKANELQYRFISFAAMQADIGCLFK